jgi:hypothetical protein
VGERHNKKPTSRGSLRLVGLKPSFESEDA